MPQIEIFTLTEDLIASAMLGCAVWQGILLACDPVSRALGVTRTTLIRQMVSFLDWLVPLTYHNLEPANGSAWIFKMGQEAQFSGRQAFCLMSGIFWRIHFCIRGT